MHEYIAHFSDLLEHAHSKKATDVGTNLLANQFIEGIDDTNKFTKNKLREKSGNNLDYYFQEAMRLQHKQEIRAIDYEPNFHTQVSECTDINALRSNNLTCFNCKSPDHFAKDCPEPNKMQQPQSNNRQNISKDSVIEACSQILERFLSNQNPMATASPNNHSTTIKLIFMLNQALSLLIDPMTIKAITSKIIANTKNRLPIPMQLRIMNPNMK